METVLITGGSGLIGNRLSKLLVEKGYKVKHLTRAIKSGSEYESFKWDLFENYIDPNAFLNVDHIIHLAGTSVTDGRWKKSKKQSILNSRIDTVKLLFNKLENQNLKTFISASGISFYGAITTDTIYKEDVVPGNDFLAQVTVKWEQAAEMFSSIAGRVIYLRTPVVLSPNGGAISKISGPIKLGIGSALGTGKQFMPWIHVDDLCDIYIKAIEDSNMNGIYNASSSQHCSNSDITQSIAKSLNNKLWPPRVPSFVLKVILGEMAQIVLNGSRVDNQKLLSTGYQFKFTDLDKAVHNCIHK